MPQGCWCHQGNERRGKGVRGMCWGGGKRPPAARVTKVCRRTVIGPAGGLLIGAEEFGGLRTRG